MLLRISLIVAILAGLGAGVVSYLEVSDKIPALVKQRDDEKSAKEQTNAVLVATQKTLNKTTADLKQTQQELAETKTARDNALARADTQKKRGDELSIKLAKVSQERDDAQNELTSFKATGLTPEQIVKINKNLKDAWAEIEAINGEKAVLQHNLVRLQTRLNKYEGTNEFVMLRANLIGKILAVDPKWDFVVLDIGEDQGILPEGELLVSRAGKLVAKVIVRSIQKDRCIANLVPGWKLGEPVEGDIVSPAHPAI
jgi:hypothetical protein